MCFYQFFNVFNKCCAYFAYIQQAWAATAPAADNIAVDMFSDAKGRPLRDIRNKVTGQKEYRYRQQRYSFCTTIFILTSLGTSTSLIINILQKYAYFTVFSSR